MKKSKSRAINQSNNQQANHNLINRKKNGKMRNNNFINFSLWRTQHENH